MGEFTSGQRAGIQILSHAIRRVAVYDPVAAELMEEKCKEIRADADSTEKMNRAYEGFCDDMALPLRVGSW